MEITLTIHSGGASREFRVTRERVVIGRAGGDGSRADGRLVVEDPGLDARHASINSEGGRVWVLDEGSETGTYLNGRPVPPQGAALAEGDQLFIGEQTTIIVHLNVRTPGVEHGASARAHGSRGELAARASGAEALTDEPAVSTRPGRAAAGTTSSVAIALTLTCVASAVVLFVALFGWRGAGGHTRPVPNQEARLSSPPAVEPAGEGAVEQPAGDAANAPTETAGEGNAQIAQAARQDGADAPTPAGVKLYRKMSDEERLRFLEERAREISMQMGNRPYAFNDEVLAHIKRYVDVYAQRVGNNSRKLWAEDLHSLFARARTRYAPHIIRAFNDRRVPPIVGLYIVMIETEYNNIGGENSAGAAGLFQFIGPTARLYGVDPAERTNIEKMAPAAAHYMADRIAEFGPDSMSVALAIAGYNRSPDSVRRDLRDVLDGQNLYNRNKERSFWTLVANSDKLDHWFQNENVKYVPKFFAAAIVGENPEAFGLEMRKLSTYTTPQRAPEAPAPSPR